VPPHIVQAIAGHNGIQVTMSIYAHAAQEEQRKALSLARGPAGMTLVAVTGCRQGHLDTVRTGGRHRWCAGQGVWARLGSNQRPPACKQSGTGLRA
jgi:hypothetical protein